MLVYNKTDQPQEAEAFMIWLYGQYRRFVYKLAWQYHSGGTETDDLTQEVWLRLCAKGELLSTYTKNQQISYISTAVRNTAISMARKTVNEYPLELAENISYNEAELLNEIFDRQMKVEVFRQVWPTVPSQVREILERKYLLLESDFEISQAMGIGKNSVRMYLTRARKTAYTVLARYREMLE